ncbi:hypothetical protein K8R32_05140 [bacterium]|nr:hypothetical protein [bacterium]
MKKKIISTIVLIFIVVSVSFFIYFLKKSGDNAKNEFRDTVIIFNMKALSTTLEIYMANNLKYPDTIDEILNNQAFKMSYPSGESLINSIDFEYQYRKHENDYELCFSLDEDKRGFEKGYTCYNRKIFLP